MTDKQHRAPGQALVSRLLHPGDRLHQRVVHAGFWASALRILDRLFGLARTVVLARLLAPEDFGLFGIALVALSTLETFSETGFNAAVIQKKGEVRPYLDTAWTVQVVRGSLLAVVLLILAPYVASFFGEPGAAALVRALALVMVLRCPANIGVVLFRKELEFHKDFLYQFSGTLADLGVAVLAGVILRSAWALLAGLVVGTAVRSVTSYLVSPYRPKFRLDRSHARELYGFGRWILANNVVLFLLFQGPEMLVGRLFGTVALAFFQMAARLSGSITAELGYVISNVTFPAYAKLQENTAALRAAFLKTTAFVADLAVPLAVGAALLGPSFVEIVLGRTWIPMSQPLVILTVSGLARALYAPTASLFRGVARPQMEFMGNVARLVVAAAVMYPLVLASGPSGVAAGLSVGAAAALPLWVLWVDRAVSLKMRLLLRALAPSVAGAMAMTVSVLLFRHVLPVQNLTRLVLCSFAAIATYLSLNSVVGRRLGGGLGAALGLIGAGLGRRSPQDE